MRDLFGRAVVRDSRLMPTPRSSRPATLTRPLIGAHRQVSVFCAVLAVVLASSPCTAVADEEQVLDLGEALALAAADQPQIESLHLQEQSARDAAHAEGELPDPKLAFGVQNLPVTGAHSFRLDSDEMTMLSVGFMQDVVTRDKRAASSARMTAEAARLAAEADAKKRDIRRDAAFAWLDTFEAQRRAATLRKLTAEISSERVVATERVASSTDGAGAVLALDMELARLRDQLIVAQRDEARARAALARWIGEHALRPLPEQLSHELLAGANSTRAASGSLDTHPSIQSAERAIDVARRDADRARADRRPDWGWQLMYGQRQDLADMVSLQVTVGLPLDRSNRQDRRISEKLAIAAAARAELLNRRRELETELSVARADLDGSIARLREHQERLLPAARTRLATAEAAYGGGSGQLLDVWQARREMVEVSLHHEMILAEGLRALIQIEWLVGTREVSP